MTQVQNTAVICMGSNVEDAPKHMSRAFAYLVTLGKVVMCTIPYLTEPENVSHEAQYSNQLIILRTPLSQTELREKTKQYESAHRVTAKPWVTIDIDTVVFNGAVVRPTDHAAAYFKRGMRMLYCF